MTGLMKRIFRRREPGQPPRRGVASLFRGRAARGRRLPGYKRIPSLRLPRRLTHWPPWKRPPEPPPQSTDATQETAQVIGEPLPPSFKDRGQLRRRLRFLRRARELGFRDIGGLIFDMRRFERSRPDLLDSKLDALLAVDQELRALERVLDDRRPFHELREPGISSCARCGALHPSEANFCPHCGMQFSGPRAMGEVGHAIAAPPQAPAPSGVAAAPPDAPAQPEWPWPAHEQPAEQPTAPTVAGTDPVTEQLTVAYVPVLQEDPPKDEPATGPAGAAAETSAAETPAAEKPAEEGLAAEKPAEDELVAEKPAEDESVAEKPAEDEPVAEKPAARKPSTRKRGTTGAKRAAKPVDPSNGTDPQDGEIPADEQRTETQLPPHASGGS